MRHPWTDNRPRRSRRLLGEFSWSGEPPNAETVTLRDGATTIGTGTISAGAATFTTASLSLGVHSIVEMESVPQPWRSGSPQDVWPRLYLWYGADSPAVESHLTCCPP